MCPWAILVVSTVISVPTLPSPLIERVVREQCDWLAIEALILYFVLELLVGSAEVLDHLSDAW
jgi:hypothetical protein